MNKFKVWRRLEIGTGKPDLKDINISDWAKDLLKKVKYSKTKKTLDLVKITPKEMGLTEDYPTTKQIYDKVKELGLELCPAEVGPILRDQYRDQALYEWLYIGMEPITDARGYPYVFRLYCDDGGWSLYSYIASVGRPWFSDNRTVFLVSKSLKFRPFDPSAKQKKPNKKHILDVTKKVVITKTFTLNGTFTEEELKELIK